MATAVQPETTWPSKLTGELEDVCRPPLEAGTLPTECYWKPEFLERERDRIFSKSWIGVGRVEDIPEPGDFFTVDIAGDSIIVVRDHQNEVRAHVNVCRHRGCRVVEGSGHTQTFKCPYHGWLYQLDGELRGTPDFDETKNFEKSDYPLLSVQTEIWEGFIAINLDPEATPFHEQLRDTSKFGVDTYGMVDQVTTATWYWNVDCNWKAYVENYIEEYHVPWVHGETFQAIAPMKGWQEYPDISSDPWAIMVGLYPGLTYSDNGEPSFRVAPRTAELPPEYDGMPIWVSFPSFGILNSVDATLYYMMLPDGPERMHLHVRLCLPADGAAAISAGDPEAVAAHEEYKRNVEAFVLEDNKIAAQQQRGVSSPHGRPGRFCKREGLAHKFDRWVVETAYLD